jgi:hypothetical protein
MFLNTVLINYLTLTIIELKIEHNSDKEPKCKESTEELTSPCASPKNVVYNFMKSRLALENVIPLRKNGVE